MARLVAIDALNIIRRNWAANPAPDGPEKLRATISTTVATLRRTLNTHQPTHQVAVFDHGGRTFRHDLFENYRASRSPMPKVLREGMGEIKAAYHSELGLASISVPGVEADDTLATLAYQWIARGRGDEPIIVSTDKDLTQMIAVGAKQWHPFDNVWLDEAWVQERFHCPSSLVGDCLALIGDSSDDVPGVRGIGPKTAGPLLVKYGGLEPLLARVHEVTGKSGERLALGQDLARLSRQLVALEMQVKVGTTWSALAVPESSARPAHDGTVPMSNSTARTSATTAPAPASSLMEMKGF